MNKEYIIPACSEMKIDVKQGQKHYCGLTLRGQVVDFAEAGGNANEFLSRPEVTIGL